MHTFRSHVKCSKTAYAKLHLKRKFLSFAFLSHFEKQLKCIDRVMFSCLCITVIFIIRRNCFYLHTVYFLFRYPSRTHERTHQLPPSAMGWGSTESVGACSTASRVRGVHGLPISPSRQRVNYPYYPLFTLHTTLTHDLPSLSLSLSAAAAFCVVAFLSLLYIISISHIFSCLSAKYFFFFFFFFCYFVFCFVFLFEFY